jgi:hypothetical protein
MPRLPARLRRLQSGHLTFPRPGVFREGVTSLGGLFKSIPVLASVDTWTINQK